MKKKAFILIFSVIVLSAILIFGFSLVFISGKERKTSFNSDDSSQALQLAHDGAEGVIFKIKELGSGAKMNELSGAISGVTCQSGGRLEGAEYFIEFLDFSGNLIDCASESVDLNSISQVKSIGFKAGKSRAITFPIVWP